MRRSRFDECAQRAYALAFFLHGNRQIAFSIVADAFAFLPVTMFRQQKRAYYRAAQPSKTQFTEAQLLQQLVMERSLLFERKNERKGLATEWDLFVRYVKFIVQRTTPHTAFHVTVGLTRFIYDYTSADCATLFESLDQNRILDMAAYRRAKARLHADVKRRFEGFLVEKIGFRGEKFFEIDQRPHRWIALLHRCMALFSPWPAERTDKNMARIQVMLEPQTLSERVRDLDLTPLDQALRIPRFVNVKDKETPEQNDHPELEAEQKEELYERFVLSKQAVTELRLLVVKVGGQEIKRWTLGGTEPVMLELDAHDDNLEIWGGSDGDLQPLCFHPLWGGLSTPEEGADEHMSLGAGRSLRFQWFDHGTVLHLSFFDNRFQRLVSTLAQWWSGMAATPRWVLVCGLILLPLLGWFLAESRARQMVEPIPDIVRSDEVPFAFPPETRTYDREIAKALFERGLHLMGRESAEDRRAALRDFELAYRLDPEFVRALEHMILAAELIGDEKKAAKYLEMLERRDQAP